MIAKAAAPRPRIAVVEDDDDLAYTLTWNLKKDGRYEVDRYAGGLVALDALVAHPPDLVLLDLGAHEQEVLAQRHELALVLAVGMLLHGHRLSPSRCKATRIVR